jgi:hypothetical protein
MLGHTMLRTVAAVAVIWFALGIIGSAAALVIFAPIGAIAVAVMAVHSTFRHAQAARGAPRKAAVLCLSVGLLVAALVHINLLRVDPFVAPAVAHAVLAAVFGLLGWRVGRPKASRAGAVGLACVVALTAVITLCTHHVRELLPRPTQQAADTEDMLVALGYIDHVPGSAGDKPAGVVLHDAEAADRGLRLYNSFMGSRAFLLNPAGDVLHTWSSPESRGSWHVVELLADGGLLVVDLYKDLVRLDAQSHVVWTLPSRVHHHVHAAPDGRFYVPAASGEVLFFGPFPTPMLAEYILVVSEGGRVEKEIPVTHPLRYEIPLRAVLRIFKRSVNPVRPLNQIATVLNGGAFFEPSTYFDTLHVNSVVRIDASSTLPFDAGSVLVSVRNLNLVCVLSSDGERVLWSWGAGQLEHQHHATILANGRIQIFDNGTRRRTSRVIEVEPASGRVIESIDGSTGEASFFTDAGGAAQRLPNGNILVTDFQAGRAIEVTPPGELAWEFFNPERTDDGTRATIYRMTRVPEDSWPP